MNKSYCKNNEIIDIIMISRLNISMVTTIYCHYKSLVFARISDFYIQIYAKEVGYYNYVTISYSIILSEMLFLSRLIYNARKLHDHDCVYGLSSYPLAERNFKVYRS